MTIPFELPVSASEASALADLVFQMGDGRTLSGELRQRMGNRLAALGFETLVPYPGSLQRDPTHQSVYYIAADGRATSSPRQLLLRIALATSPASGLFPESVLIGRMRPAGGREIIVNGIPFSPSDTRHILTFAEQVDRAFLPRPQGAQSSITVGGSHPESKFPAAFTAFRDIHRKTGRNFASVAGPYETCLWAAIRAGWREGYNAEAPAIDIAGAGEDETAACVEAIRDEIRRAPGYTRFTAALPPPGAGAGRDIEDRFHQILAKEEAGWALEEFSRAFSAGEEHYELSRSDVMRLAVNFARGLKLIEEIQDAIRLARIQAGFGRMFDFELSFAQAENPTTPRDLLFCLHWLKSRGRPAQLAAPRLGPRVSDSDLPALAAVARYFNTTLSIASGSGPGAGFLAEIARATAGRWNYKIADGLCDAANVEWLAEQLRA
ncbi:MAG: tagaturonate epimerase family protein [Bryobacterales bacterium]|nr:tagaturonate epimerase family protein [Bryobacterales bacterium]